MQQQIMMLMMNETLKAWVLCISVAILGVIAGIGGHYEWTKGDVDKRVEQEVKTAVKGEKQHWVEREKRRVREHLCRSNNVAQQSFKFVHNGKEHLLIVACYSRVIEVGFGLLGNYSHIVTQEWAIQSTEGLKLSTLGKFEISIDNEASKPLKTYGNGYVLYLDKIGATSGNTAGWHHAWIYFNNELASDGQIWCYDKVE